MEMCITGAINYYYRGEESDRIYFSKNVEFAIAEHDILIKRNECLDVIHTNFFLFIYIY